MVCELNYDAASLAVFVVRLLRCHAVAICNSSVFCYVSGHLLCV